MKKSVLFIQGGGEHGYVADALLSTSLQKELGPDYNVRYPELVSDESLPDFGWLQQIGEHIHSVKNDLYLVGHSLGASFILKYLSENRVPSCIRGIFLIATPFWQGDEDWKLGLKLDDDFAEKLPQNVPVFLYHSKDDDEVPFAHVQIYARKLPHATVREAASGGHQLNNDMAIVGEDIRLV